MKLLTWLRELDEYEVPPLWGLFFWGSRFSLPGVLLCLGKIRFRWIRSTDGWEFRGMERKPPEVMT